MTTMNVYIGGYTYCHVFLSKKYTLVVALIILSHRLAVLLKVLIGTFTLALGEFK